MDVVAWTDMSPVPSNPPFFAVAAGGVDASTADDADRKAVDWPDEWQVEEVELKIKPIPFLELSRDNDKMLIECLFDRVFFIPYTFFLNLFSYHKQGDHVTTLKDCQYDLLFDVLWYHWCLHTDAYT